MKLEIAEKVAELIKKRDSFKFNNNIEVCNVRISLRDKTTKSLERWNSDIDLDGEIGNIVENCLTEYFKNRENIINKQIEEIKNKEAEEIGVEINETKAEEIKEEGETIVENKHSIILGGVLINPKDKTWGKPDLIVRGDWIKNYILQQDIPVENNLWYIIDIKSSTMRVMS